MKNKQVLSLPSVYSIISELRLPLVELNLLNQQGDLTTSSEVAQQTLTLFDSFLYAQKLENINRQDLEYTPYSLVIATEECLHRVEAFAKLYGVNLQLEFDHKHRQSVGLVKPAFDCATHSLLYSIISASQNQTKADLKIKISHRNWPSLRFLGSNLKLSKASKTNLVNKFNIRSSGLGSGLVLAHFIYSQIGSAVNLIANQHGQGLKINFKTIQQISLIRG